MALNAQGYFNCLKSYLNTNHYGEPQASNGEVVSLRRPLWHGAGGFRKHQY